MKNRFVQMFWGDIQGPELKKFFLLSLGMFFIIGSFWPIKILKDSVFLNMVGPTYIPLVKIVSLAFFFFLVAIYSRIIPMLSREKMAYLLITLFAATGFICSYFLSHPAIGIANSTINTNRIFAWLFYMFIESYGGFLVAFYWSLVNDVTTPESAKRGYGMIIFGSQVGGLSAMLVSNYFVRDAASYLCNVPWILRAAMVMLLAVGFIIFLLHRVVSEKELEGYSGNNEKKDHFSIGFFEGLKVLVSRPYVAGIFGIIFFHECITTVMQFHMQILAAITYNDPALITQFLFRFGFIVQLTACLFSLFGTSYFQRVFGIRFCLVMYPLLLSCAIIGYVFYPTLFSITVVMIIAKAINYALNVPAKEMLYIPTSKDIRYTSKAWIDVFGARLSKATGSFANVYIGPVVMTMGGMALLCIGFWVFLAHKVGTAFISITRENRRVE